MPVTVKIEADSPEQLAGYIQVLAAGAVVETSSEMPPEVAVALMSALAGTLTGGANEDEGETPEAAPEPSPPLPAPRRT